MAESFALDSDEKVELDVRRHGIAMLPVWSSSILIVLLAVGLGYVVGRYSADVTRYVPVWLLVLMLVVLAGLGLVILLTGLWVYRRNRLILTNKHLVKVEQIGLFGHKVSQLSLTRVQDVNGSRRGLVATIFDFGTVEVQSAGEDEEFIFTQMPHPSRLADQLMKAHDRQTADAPSGEPV